MKPPRFLYFDPRTLDDTLSLLAEYGERAKILAGGQSLVPMLNFRLLAPDCLIDINRVDGLSGISAEGKDVAIGAMTRQRTIERSAELCRMFPLLAEVMPQIAHFQIRNRGTLGGSLCHADPAAELPAAIIALNGRLVLASARGSRTVAAKEFFRAYLTTDLEPDELLVKIVLPPPAPHSGSAFLEVSRRHGDFALVGVAVLLSLDDRRQCDAAEIVLTGVAPTPYRPENAAAALRGSRLEPDTLKEAARLTADRLEPQSDIHASSAYRCHAAQVLTFRALAAAADRARANAGGLA